MPEHINNSIKFADEVVSKTQSKQDKVETLPVRWSDIEKAIYSNGDWFTKAVFRNVPDHLIHSYCREMNMVDPSHGTACKEGLRKNFKEDIKRMWEETQQRNSNLNMHLQGETAALSLGLAHFLHALNNFITASMNDIKFAWKAGVMRQLQQRKLEKVVDTIYNQDLDARRLFENASLKLDEKQMATIQQYILNKHGIKDMYDYRIKKATDPKIDQKIRNEFASLTPAQIREILGDNSPNDEPPDDGGPDDDDKPPRNGAIPPLYDDNKPLGDPSNSYEELTKKVKDETLDNLKDEVLNNSKQRNSDDALGKRTPPENPSDNVKRQLTADEIKSMIAKEPVSSKFEDIEKFASALLGQQDEESKLTKVNTDNKSDKPQTSQNDKGRNNDETPSL